jgi:hypothetical protein
MRNRFLVFSLMFLLGFVVSDSASAEEFFVEKDLSLIDHYVSRWRRENTIPNDADVEFLGSIPGLRSYSSETRILIYRVREASRFVHKMIVTFPYQENLVYDLAQFDGVPSLMSVDSVDVTFPIGHLQISFDPQTKSKVQIVDSVVKTVREKNDEGLHRANNSKC